MDHLRIYLQIIVKFQLASANYTPSCRALSPRLELACIVLNGTQYRGDRGTVEHWVQWNFCNIFIEYAIGLVIFLYSGILQC